MNKRCSLLIALLALLLQAPAPASESAWVIERGSSYWELQGGYGGFSESAGPIQQLSFSAHGEIGFLETATLLLDLPFLTRNLERTGQTPVNLTNNGLTSVFIGSRIRLIDEPFALALKAAVRTPAGSDPSFLPVIGDHTLDFELGLNGGFDFFPLEAYVQGGLGYRLRGGYNKTHALVNQARLQGQTLTKPADQITGFVEAGVWILPQLFASLGLAGDFAVPQADSRAQSQLLLRPLLAWRITPYADLSLQLDQALWSQNAPFLTQIALGGHFRFGLPLARGKGLRGSIPDHAEYDPQIP